MYKGFITERAFYNSKIHALAIIIAGLPASEEFLRNEVWKVANKRKQPFGLFAGVEVPVKRVSELTDLEARQLYYDLLTTCRKVKANVKTTNAILGLQGNQMSDEQRKKLIKITKYNFKWSAEVTFSKIVEICPELGKRLTPWQIKNTKLLPLFNLMNKKQADKIIKRLEKIEERNKNEVSK